MADRTSSHAMLYIDGQFREARSRGRFDVINPADETVIGSAADAIGMSFHLAPDTPTGGYGISGLGRESGVDGFKEYLQARAKTIASPAR